VAEPLEFSLHNALFRLVAATDMFSSLDEKIS